MSTNLDKPQSYATAIKGTRRERFIIMLTKRDTAGILMVKRTLQLRGIPDFK